MTDKELKKALLEINKLTVESSEWKSKCYNLQQENEMLRQSDRNTYETSQEIMAELQTKINKAVNYLRELKCNAPEETAINKAIEILIGGADDGERI